MNSLVSIGFHVTVAQLAIGLFDRLPGMSVGGGGKTWRSDGLNRVAHPLAST